MLKTVRGDPDVNINYWWNLMLKTVRGAVNINHWWTPYIKTLRMVANINY